MYRRRFTTSGLGLVAAVCWPHDAAAATLLVLLLVPQTHGQAGLARGVHDPCIAKEGGSYYVFSTGKGIGIRRSSDLVHWQWVGHVFDALPTWATRAVPAADSLWAPDTSFFNGEYHLYYSVSTFGSNRSCIGLATSKTLDPNSRDYKWQDHGKVIESKDHDDWNAIDPNIVLDETNRPWLSFGSFWSGIKMCEIDARTGKPFPNRPPLISLAARPKAKAIEAPFVVHHGRHYYLFVSFDHCCRGADSDYKIMVGRSDKVFGPYAGKNGRPMLQGGGTLALEGQGRVRGPGHNAVLIEGGKYWLVHHFYDAQDNGVPYLQIRPLTWDADGWPVAGIALSAHEEKAKSLSRDQLVGKWRHFVEREPREITLLKSGKINGDDSKATWSIEGIRLTLTWPTKGAPGGAWVDTCQVSDDGKHYSGKNQKGARISGEKFP